MLNNAKKTFNSIFNSIFLRIIHSKKLFIYFFKELFIQKIIQLEKTYSKKYSFKKIDNYSFKKLFI